MFWQILYAVGATAFSLAGGGSAVVALSSWLGKVWAD